MLENQHLLTRYWKRGFSKVETTNPLLLYVKYEIQQKQGSLLKV